MFMEFATRSLSPQESRVVLALTEHGRREVARPEIVQLLGVSPKAADHVINSLRRKGWLERASWGKYLVIPPDQGPDALGESNLLALASRIADPYYIGYGTAAAHYGLTTQHRNVIWLVTPVHLRDRRVGQAEVRIVNPVSGKFFGFGAVDVLGYQVRHDGHRLYRPPGAGRWCRRGVLSSCDREPPARLAQGSRLSRPDQLSCFGPAIRLAGGPCKG
jgi:predicted transcriptional regulator of viral defense system